MPVTLTIPQWHPATVNQLLHSVGSRIRLKKADRAIVAVYARQQQIPQATGKRRLAVRIILGKGQRARDPDSYFKSLEDACVHAGLLVDDSHQYVELAPVTFARDAQHWGTVIQFEDM